MIAIDGDALVYIAGFSADSRNGIKSHSLHDIKVILKFILKEIGEEDFKVFLTSKDSSVNFRTRIYPEYKGNRKKKCRTCYKSNVMKSGVIESEPTKDGNLCRRRLFKCLEEGCDGFAADTKPVYYQAIRNFLVKRYNAVVVQWGEADDWFHGADWIVTHDKDIYMLLDEKTNIYNIKSKNVVEGTDFMGSVELLELPVLTPEGDYIFNKNGSMKVRKELKGQGFLWFCVQLVMGDKVDNIIKLEKGFGPVKIYDMFKDVATVTDAWTTVIAYYEKNQALDKLELMCQLLWISRKPKEVGDLKTIKKYVLQHETKEKLSDGN